MAGGRRGPAPKPTAIKKARGNPGRRKLNEREPVFELAPKDPPAWLNDVAAGEWNRVYPLLAEQSLISKVDTTALGAYCLSYADFLEADKAIQDEGAVKLMTGEKGNQYWAQSPWVSIKNKAQQMMLRFAQEFGLTPSSRQRLEVESATDRKKAGIVEMATGEAVEG